MKSQALEPILEEEGGELTPLEGAELVNFEAVKNPEVMIADGMRLARALKSLMDKKKHKVILNPKRPDEQYLEFADWQTLGLFSGISVRVVHTQFVEYGNARGFEARAEAFQVKTGRVLSAAEAACLNDEEKWRARPKYVWKNGKRVADGEEAIPLFQLKSMAQTRAGGKAFRQVLSWVAKLGGFSDTPAEEFTGNEFGNHEPPPYEGYGRPEEGRPSAPPPHQSSPQAPRPLTEAQVRMIQKKCVQAGVTPEALEAFLSEKFKTKVLAQVPIGGCDAILSWVSEKTPAQREPGWDG